MTALRGGIDQRSDRVVDRDMGDLVRCFGRRLTFGRCRQPLGRRPLTFTVVRSERNDNHENAAVARYIPNMDIAAVPPDNLAGNRKSQP